MSGPLAVVAIIGLLTCTGLGVLALLGVAGRPRQLYKSAGIAPLAGMAWTGCIGALVPTIGVRLTPAGAVVIALATIAAGAIRMRTASTPPTSAQLARTRLDLILILASVCVIGLVSWSAFRLFRLEPLSGYDGWAIWGMKARALATVGAKTEIFASPAYSRLHLEYPLLLPAVHSLTLQWSRGFTSNTVVLSCLAIGLSGVLAIWAILRERVRPALLLPFLAALVAMPAFFVQLATGYADVPVAIFVAAGLVAAARWLLEDARAWLALATLFLAAAALVKNEGLLFAAVILVGLLVTAEGRRRVEVVACALAIALIYAPWRAYTSSHDLKPSDYDLGSSLDLSKLSDRLSHLGFVSNALLEQAFDRRQFGVVLGFGLVAVALALLVGPRRLGALAALFSVLSFAGLAWIYVLAPFDLKAFLPTNDNRVVMSLIVGLGALSPLLIEEVVRRLTAADGESGCVGTP